MATRIVLSLLLLIVTITVTTILAIVTTSIVSATSLGLGIGNITDGKPRIALIQEEDFSLSLYQTINGTTIQIAGFDNLMEAVDYFNNEILLLEEPKEEELTEIEEQEESDSGNSDGGSSDNDNNDGNGDDNNDEPEPAEELQEEPEQPDDEELELIVCDYSYVGLTPAECIPPRELLE